MSSTLSFLSRSGVSLLLVAGCVFLMGCGNDSNKEGKVTGKVIYKNHPLRGGNLNLLSKETGAAATAKLNSSGTFELDQPLEAGKYLAYVTPPYIGLATPASKSPKASDSKGSAEKERDPIGNGVTITIEPGENELTIELTD